MNEFESINHNHDALNSRPTHPEWEAEPQAPGTAGGSTIQASEGSTEQFTDENGIPVLFPLSRKASAPAARFQVLVDCAEVFENEDALEASIMASAEAQKALADYLGYDDLEFESQAPVLPGTKMAVDIVARRSGSSNTVAVFELALVQDTDHVHKTVSYAKLCGARHAVLISPVFPNGVKTLVETLQRKDSDGITLHMVRVYAFRLQGESQHRFSFHPLTTAKAPSQTITDLEDITRRANALGDNSLSIDSIRVDGNGRVRLESGAGLGTHSFIRISSHQKHARVSVVIKDAELKQRIDKNWPRARMIRIFSSLPGFESAPYEPKSSVVDGYNFRVTDPTSPAVYHNAVAEAYIALRNVFSHLLADEGQVTTQRTIPFLAQTGAPQIMSPPPRRLRAQQLRS